MERTALQLCQLNYLKLLVGADLQVSTPTSPAHWSPVEWIDWAAVISCSYFSEQKD